MLHRNFIKIYVKLKKHYEGCSTVNLMIVKKYSGSHRKVRPTGAEYKNQMIASCSVRLSIRAASIENLNVNKKWNEALLQLAERKKYFEEQIDWKLP